MHLQSRLEINKRSTWKVVILSSKESCCREEGCSNSSWKVQCWSIISLIFYFSSNFASKEFKIMMKRGAEHWRIHEESSNFKVFKIEFIKCWELPFRLWLDPLCNLLPKRLLNNYQKLITFNSTNWKNFRLKDLKRNFRWIREFW